ncbi:MAG: trypsin-like serine protease [Deltaproteobacteria bacterium]|nr:trypsin-like serine protease [Deltaproteobacteria bacterium]
MLLRTFALDICLLLLLVLPAGAAIIDSGDGAGNTSAPADDPGWASVGVRGGLTAIHIRNGWVLSANHVAVGPTTFDGIVYEAIPGSATRLETREGTFADLKIWGVYPHPPLPDLTIRSSTAQPNGEIIMIGHGRNRGAATDTDNPVVWMPPPDPPNPPKAGYLWASGLTMRWGTNRIDGKWLPHPNDTVSWYAIFDEQGSGYTTDEAQAAVGDSGGAVFFKQGGSWELMGVMHTVSLWPGDPDFPDSGQQFNSALYGNATAVADLSAYRDQILDLTAVPEPGGGLMLLSGVAFLLVTGRGRLRY